MDKTPDPSTAIALTMGAACRDGSHTGNDLARKVRTGRALRIRRGVYAEPPHWIEAKPWQRYRMAVAATAMMADPIFCRETALLLHGAPLIRTPPAVLARTTRSGGTGKIPGPALTGPLAATQFRSLYREQHESASDFSLSRLRNVPTRLLYPPLPQGMSRQAALEGARSGELPNHQLRVEPGSRQSSIQGPADYRTEPLELALIDTVSRLSFEEAVVVLDWVKAHRELSLEPWFGYLTNGRMRRRWDLAWDFATPQSESPGESRSRVLMDELGFAAPSLQTVVDTDRGSFRVDFCWVEDGVIGEFDGRVKYFDDELLEDRDPKEILHLEKQREDALRRAGWMVIRWTWADLNEPARLAAFLRRAGVRRLR